MITSVEQTLTEWMQSILESFQIICLEYSMCVSSKTQYFSTRQTLYCEGNYSFQSNGSLEQSLLKMGPSSVNIFIEQNSGLQRLVKKGEKNHSTGSNLPHKRTENSFQLRLQVKALTQTRSHNGAVGRWGCLLLEPMVGGLQIHVRVCPSPMS